MGSMLQYWLWAFLTTFSIWRNSLFGFEKGPIRAIFQRAPINFRNDGALHSLLFSLYSWSSSSSSLHFIIRTYHDKTCVESPLRILMDISHGSISNGCFFFFALDGLWYRSRSLRSHCTGWERKPICVIGCWCDMHKFMFISPKCKAAALYRYI